MNFLLIGHGGCYNRGCEAIVRSTITMLQTAYDNPRVVISSLDYENDKAINFGPNTEVIPAFSDLLWKRFSMDWFARQFYKLSSKDMIDELEFSPIVKHLKNADVVLSVGGDNYSNDYGYLDYYLRLNKLVNRFGKKLVIWGASIGPFAEDNNIYAIIENLSSAALITVRETASYEYLKNLGMDKNIKLVADPAFVLPVQKVTEFDLNKVFERPVLGFNVSPLLERYVDNNNIIEECSKFLKKVTMDIGYTVMLIPHVMKNNNDSNDYMFMREIAEKTNNKNRVILLEPIYNAMQSKYIISKCSYFIGARTHSTIASLSAGVPTLSISYSLKSKGINRDIFGDSRHLIDVTKVTENNLFMKLGQLIKNGEETKNVLRKKMPDIKKMAWKNIEYLKQTSNRSQTLQDVAYV